MRCLKQARVLGLLAARREAWEGSSDPTDWQNDDTLIIIIIILLLGGGANWRKVITGWLLCCSPWSCSMQVRCLLSHNVQYHLRAVGPDNCGPRLLKSFLLLNGFRHLSQWWSLIKRCSALRSCKRSIKFQLSHLFCLFKIMDTFFIPSALTHDLLLFWWSDGHDLEPFTLTARSF